MENKKKLTQGQILGFSLSSLTNGNIMNVCNAYYSFFLTNIVMMNAADMGTLTFLSRILSALVIPFMSAMMQNVVLGSGKFGKYRTWLAVACPLISVFFMLTFINWGFGRVGAMIYYFLVYFIAITLYTIPQTCVTTLMSRMGNLEDTKAISARRSQLATVCTLISSSFTLPMVNALGGDDKGKGYMLVVVIYSVWFLLGYISTIIFSKHADYYPGDVENKKVKTKLSTKDQWNAFKSKSHLMLFLSACVMYIGSFLYSGSTTYYFTYVIGDLNKVTLFLTLGSVSSIVGTVFTGGWMKLVGSKKAYLYVQVLMAVVYLLAFFFGANYIVFYILIGVISRFLSGLSISALPVNISLAADEHKLNTGVDAKAWMMSMSNLPVKGASALTAGMVGWGLALAGFDAALPAQPQSVITTISVIATLIPAIGYGLSALFAALFPIDNKRAAEIQAQLAEKAAK